MGVWVTIGITAFASSVPGTPLGWITGAVATPVRGDRPSYCLGSVATVVMPETPKIFLLAPFCSR